MGTLGTSESDGGGEIFDSNYSDQPLETVIGLSFLDNETNESTLGFPVKDDLFPDYPAQLTNLTAVICVIFCVVGSFGNLYTMLALAKCKKVTYQDLSPHIPYSFSSLSNV